MPQNRPDESRNALAESKLFGGPLLRKTKFGKYLIAIYSSGHESESVKYQTNCIGLDEKED